MACVRICSAPARLPLFNPDLEQDTHRPEIVERFRQSIAAADAMIVSVPEYVGSIPGAFKNALDWLVGCPRFAGKPVAVWCASSRSAQTQATLRIVLKTMSAAVTEEASFVTDASPRWQDLGPAAEVDGKIVRALKSLAAVVGRATHR